jgi:hypothetical protein
VHSLITDVVSGFSAADNNIGDDGAVALAEALVASTTLTAVDVRREWRVPHGLTDPPLVCFALPLTLLRTL